MRAIDVSVIIPVYNAEKYLERCVESIMENNTLCCDTELILIDDGSDDASGRICDLLQERYVNVKVSHQINRGVSDARNEGIRMAEGKYILFCDADDYMVRGGVEILLQGAESTESEFVMADILKIDYNGKKIKRVWEKTGKKYVGAEIDTMLLAYLREPRRYNLLSFVWNKLFVTEIIKRHQLRFDESLKINEDALFVFEYFNYINKAYYIQKDTYCYCTDQENIGTNHMQDNPYAYEKSLRMILQRLRRNAAIRNQAEEYFYHAFTELAIRNMFHIIRCYQGKNRALYDIIRAMLRHQALQAGIRNYSGHNTDNFKIIPFLIRTRQAYLLIYTFRLQILLKNIRLRQ